MVNKLNKFFKLYFVYYSIVQLIGTISYFIECYMPNILNISIYANILYTALLLAGVIFPFIVIGNIKTTNLLTIIKQVIKDYWIGYLLIAGVIWYMRGDGMSLLLSASAYFSIPPRPYTLAENFVIIYIQKFFLSEFAFLFFVFAPCISHVVDYSKNQKLSEDIL